MTPGGGMLEGSSILTRGKTLTGEEATSLDHAIALVGPLGGGLHALARFKSIKALNREDCYQLFDPVLGRRDLMDPPLVELRNVYKKNGSKKKGSGKKYRSKGKGLDLKAFANKVGGLNYDDWHKLGIGYIRDNFSNWGEAFTFVMDTTISQGRKVHFNLDGVKLGDRITKPNPKVFGRRYTDYELQNILLNKKWLKNTIFYRKGKPINREYLEKTQGGDIILDALKKHKLCID